MKPVFKLAEIDDADRLTAISISAFHTDFEVAGRSAPGGPPGYDSSEFHKRMINEASKFFKVVLDNESIGAFWFFRNDLEKAYLYRLFISPEYHREGIGGQIFNFLFTRFSEIQIWTLKVPKWNTRTPKFYQKAGFRINGQDEHFFFFEKRTQNLK